MVERAGGDRQQAFDLASQALKDIEDLAAVMAKNGVPPQICSRVSVNVLILTCLARVCIRDAPLYGSRALTLQLEAQLEQLLPQLEVLGTDALRPEDRPGATVLKVSVRPDDDPAREARLERYVMRIDEMMADADEDANNVLSLASTYLVHVLRKIEHVTGTPFQASTLFQQIEQHLDAKRTEQPFDARVQ
jgi:hypothetical protein